MLFSLMSCTASSQSPQSITTPSLEAPPEQHEWPRTIQDAHGKLVIYQPQVEAWKDYQILEARAALGFAPQGSEAQPQLGIMTLQAETEVDYETRLVKITRVHITGARFPSLDQAQSDKTLALLREVIQPHQLSISMDRILASLRRGGSLHNVQVKNDPPPILVSEKPAILVVFDGAPLFSPIKETGLKFAVNTNWDVFQHEASQTYYLRDDSAWLQAAAVKGVWTPVATLPEAFTRLPNDENWKDVKANIPGKPLAAEHVPQVLVSEVPAELIVLQGKPQYQPIPQTNLLWVTNTQSHLFFSAVDNDYYYLVSGRWFRSKDLQGPWAFATSTLPEDFQKIPADHPRGDVRASVPGTREAEEAVIQASIPQTARVNKKEMQAPDVVYGGDKPVFTPIARTSLAYASNTAYEVIQDKSSYYLCYQGIWFVSTSPTGPWEVAEKIPAAIYTIPPSNPLYHTTYVTVIDDNPDDEWVTVALWAGYFGTFLAADALVWGTGWYYPPYVWWGPVYPIYYPYAYSYGVGAFYNPYTGTFGRYGYAYGPYGGVGFGAAYNPRTGTYARGVAAYGPYRAGGFAEAYNPRTDTYARTRQGSNYYSSWGSTVIRRGDEWARTAHYSNAEGGVLHYRTADGDHGFVGYKGDDLYAGRDGNLYRKTDDGWQKYDHGQWENAPQSREAHTRPPATNRPELSGETLHQLDRDRVNRQWGAQRSMHFHAWQRGGGLGGLGGFRGGFHGGLRR
jgi:hypothetical protein